MTERRPRVLVAEDDEGFAKQLSAALDSEDYDVVVVHDGRGALKTLDESSIDLGFIDLAMPGVDGMTVLEEALRVAPEVPLVMITGYATIERAVQATRLGAYDFIEKPANLDRILLTAKRALEKHRLQQSTNWMAEDILARYKMVGTSAAMQELYHCIDKVVSTDSAVLITGETGTGKELVSMAIHLQGKRSAGPFVRVNCAAIPDTLIESELFGHRKGAFTGAIQDKTGKFVQASGGTIFLDEVGDLSPWAQAKILRVLEDHEVEPLGNTRTHKVDVRIVAATNKDLRSLLTEGQYRDDLYYRLSSVEIHVPPLRDKKEDIPDLVSHFLQLYCEENNRYIQGLEPRALQLLVQQDWPGNVRQLRSTVERLVVFATGEVITAEETVSILGSQDIEGVEGAANYQQATAAFQCEFLTQALVAHGWNISATAKTLGIHRTNLFKKMRRFGIKRPRPKG